MKSLLREKLRYLSDDKTARQIITGTYNIPEKMDTATKSILKEIDRMGEKIVNEEGSKIEITSEDFQCFWRRVKEFTYSSLW